jgi:hypothetical protein
MRILSMNTSHPKRFSTSLKEAGLFRTFASILNSDDDEFGAHAALYWFCSDNHGGQDCPLYSLLSQSKYSPGALESECPEEYAHHYADLQAAWDKANN